MMRVLACTLALVFHRRPQPCAPGSTHVQRDDPTSGLRFLIPSLGLRLGPQANPSARVSPTSGQVRDHKGQRRSALVVAGAHAGERQTAATCSFKESPNPPWAYDRSAARYGSRFDPSVGITRRLHEKQGAERAQGQARKPGNKGKRFSWKSSRIQPGRCGSV
jgi:hypothetical protein